MRISSLLGKIAVIVVVLVGSVTAWGKIIYVDANAPGADDGTSWENAYNFLQDALANADSSAKPVEVRVAQGIYVPDSNSAVPDGTGDREATFQLISGVTMNGGYAGFYEEDPNARDVEAYETILSGDLDGNDVEVDDPCELPNEPTRDENSYHVVNSSGCDQTTILDGFVIYGGNADGNDFTKGGGLYNDSGSPLISNCIFTGNSSLDYGGGLFINGLCNAVITDCEIIGNHADDGGGIFTDEFDCSPLITNCIIKNNSAFDNGGGIRCDDYSTPTISNCLIVANVAFDEGGGVACKWECSPKIYNCTIAGNFALIGGGVYSKESIVEVTNSILWDNAADNGSEIALERIAEDEPSLHPTELTISYSNVQGGPADVYVDSNCTNCVLNWAEGNLEADPLFAIRDNDFHLRSSAGRWDPNSQTWVTDVVTSPCIDAGNPGCLLGDEPNDPNNIRINMGAHGGTEEASKTPINWRSIADLTNDWVVDFNDLKVFVSYWLEEGECVPSDFNRSQNVDFFDYAIFANNWLQESKISCHVFSIWIETAWDYKAPGDLNDTGYIFDLEVLTDSRVERIEFITPSAPNIFEIPMIPEQLIEIAGGWIKTEWEYDLIEGICEWDYTAHFYNPNDLATYGDGEYMITVYYNDGRQDQTIVWFGIPDTNSPIPQPIQEPVFTSFSDGDILISPVTIIWQNCTDPAANLIWVGLETESTPEEDYDFLLEVDVNALDEPLPLVEGLWEAGLGYEVWYHAQNIDGIYAVVGKYSESSYEFRVVPLPEKMVKIPEGEFDMGDHQGDGSSNERPVHAVFLESFIIGKYEITNRQYCDYLNSAMLAGDIKVIEGRVYDFNDTGDYPYCDTRSLASFYSQIDYNDVSGTFTVRTKTGRDMSNDPMIEVSWYGASAYCNWRSKQDGYQTLYNPSDPNWPCDFTKRGYRLPTEAEWEYVARGGLSGRRFPWGDTISHTKANYQSYWSLGSPIYPYDVSPTRDHHPTWKDLYTPFTSPVGFFDGTIKYKDDYNWPGSVTSYQTAVGSNGYGLYDMAGNVWEWCNDWYNSTYYSLSPYDNPKGPVSGTFRVFRGGSWDDHAIGCRVADRNEGNPGLSSRYRGFRVVLDLD